MQKYFTIFLKTISETEIQILTNSNSTGSYFSSFINGKKQNVLRAKSALIFIAETQKTVHRHQEMKTNRRVRVVYAIAERKIKVGIKDWSQDIKKFGFFARRD